MEHNPEENKTENINIDEVIPPQGNKENPSFFRNQPLGWLKGLGVIVGTAAVVLMMLFAIAFGISSLKGPGLIDKVSKFQYTSSPVEVVSEYEAGFFTRVNRRWSTREVYVGRNGFGDVRVVVVFPKKGNETWLWNSTTKRFQRQALPFQQWKESQG